MAVSLETVPEGLRKRIGPEAPEPVRMMVARALVPMGPQDLFTALAYLASNTDGEIADTARKSISEMPHGVIRGVIESSERDDLLDFSLREFIHEDELVNALILNTALSDDSMIWAARKGSGKQIELIANNQERVSRLPKLVEAIYYNPEAPMAVVTRVFETAVRSGLSLNHIPGYREIYESIFGRSATTAEEPKVDEVKAETELVEEQPEQEVPLHDEIDSDVEQVLDDDVFNQALINAANEEETSDGGEEQKEERKSMHAMIEEMSVPQKVRLALVGSSTARAILIKDGKQIVARSVLQNPQITEKEIATFAKNKAISEMVIQAICRNREWTKNATIQISLIHHPKTPAVNVNRWIRALNKHRLKLLSKNREVPSYVSRLAKNVLTTRENSK